MKNFEESLRQLRAPDLQVAEFRQKLRSDLSVARGEWSRRRWRTACLASSALSLVLAIALAAFVAAPDVPRVAGIADSEISVDNDREFIESYYARQGTGVRIQSVDTERLVAIREFTLSDGRQMVVYTELDEGPSNASTTPVEERFPMLASQRSTTF